MMTLPIEIITIILSMLPVKSLLRFKCICKSWYSLIKSPNFIKLHLNQTLISDSDRHLLLYYPFLHFAELNHLSFSKLRHPLSPKQVHFLGSCNGIICIADPSKTDIFLFNPLTKSHRKLPETHIRNPNLGFMIFGFGYDTKSYDYKVLCMVQGYTDDCAFFSESKLYSLNNNSWKSVQGIPYFLPFEDCHGVLVNEALHYVVISKDSSARFIASFDLRTESFSRIDFPKFDVKLETNLVPFALELGGSLCVLVNYHSVLRLQSADFWVMKEYGNDESWFKLIRLCEPGSIGSCMQIKPVVYSKDGKRILVEIDVSKFGWYDLKSKNVEVFKPHGLPDGALETGSFLGSLVSFEDKLHSETETTLPRKSNKKNHLGNFLSTGFKLRL